MSEKYGLIVNPNSGQNRKSPKRKQKIHELVASGCGVSVETRSLDALAETLEDFLDRGIRYWVADGGDGSFHCMMNTAIEHFGEDILERIVFVPTGGGTVNYVAANTGVPSKPSKLIRALNEKLENTDEPRCKELSSLRFVGKRLTESGEEETFERVGFGFALAGYGSNIFEPVYRNPEMKGPIGISYHLARAFSAGAAQTFIPGSLDGLKPSKLRKAEWDYLRPMPGDVWIDGQRIEGPGYEKGARCNVVHVSALSLNLAGIFRVFPRAGETGIHAQAGIISPAKMALAMPFLCSGGSPKFFLPGAWDGPAHDLKVMCDENQTINPVLDGEIELGFHAAHVTKGPKVKVLPLL